MAELGTLALIVETEPDPENTRLLERRLYEFNVQATGIADGKLFALFLRETDGTVVGGAYGWSWGGTCFLRDLFVPAVLELDERLLRIALGVGVHELQFVLLACDSNPPTLLISATAMLIPCADIQP
jgi:hypothetical protein